MEWLRRSIWLVTLGLGSVSAAADVPQLTTSRLVRTLVKESVDHRYRLDSRLTPAPLAQKSSRFTLNVALSPKIGAAVCASASILFANGFETP